MIAYFDGLQGGKFVVRLTKFFGEVKEELTKVAWPTKKQTVRLTVIVIVISAVVGIYLSAIDILSTEFLKLIVKK